MTIYFGQREACLAATLTAVLVVAGCASLEELAPLVGKEAVRLAEIEGIDPQRIEGGRAIYVTQCARCHTPEWVGRYSAAQWHQTLPRMTPRAKLSHQEAADLEAYIMTTLGVVRAAGAVD